MERQQKLIEIKQKIKDKFKQIAAAGANSGTLGQESSSRRLQVKEAPEEIDAGKNLRETIKRRKEHEESEELPCNERFVLMKLKNNDYLKLF